MVAGYIESIKYAFKYSYSYITIITEQTTFLYTRNNFEACEIDNMKLVIRQKIIDINNIFIFGLWNYYDNEDIVKLWMFY